MITKTSLLHPEMQRKLFIAMSKARVLSLKGKHSAVYITNKQGKPFIRVMHDRESNTGFSFYSGNKNLKKVVFNALQGV